MFSIAELHRNKGLDVALHGIALLPKETQDKITYSIIGDGEEKENLEEFKLIPRSNKDDFHKKIKNAVQERIKQIEQALKNADSDFDKDKLQERLAKLSGGVAVIKVGAATETEMKEKKDRIEDALHATRAAVEEGIVSGGGIILLKAREYIDKLNLENDEKLGALIVKKALEEPLRVISSNAGFDSSVIIDKILQNNSINLNSINGKHIEKHKLVPSGVYYYVCNVFEHRITGIEHRTLLGFVHIIEKDTGKQK